MVRRIGPRSERIILRRSRRPAGRRSAGGRGWSLAAAEAELALAEVKVSLCREVVFHDLGDLILQISMFVCPIYILLLSICEPTIYHVWTTLHFLSKGVITLAKKGNGWRVKCDKGPVAVGRRSGLD